MSIKRTLISGLFVAAGILLSSCEEDFCDDDFPPYAPDDCVEREPDFGMLDVLVTINSENVEVPITLYLGNIEENNILAIDTLSVERTTYMLPANEEYSATAAYLGVTQDTVLVVNSDRIFTSDTEYCDGTCWEVVDGEVDLRIF